MDPLEKGIGTSATAARARPQSTERKENHHVYPHRHDQRHDAEGRQRSRAAGAHPGHHHASRERRPVPPGAKDRLARRPACAGAGAARRRGRDEGSAHRASQCRRGRAHGTSGLQAAAHFLPRLPRLVLRRERARAAAVRIRAERRPKKTAAGKAVAVTKAKATRAARGTKGRKQKATIKGAPTVPAATAGSSAPQPVAGQVPLPVAPAAPPAASPGAAPGHMVSPVGVPAGAPS